MLSSFILWNTSFLTISSYFSNRFATSDGFCVNCAKKAQIACLKTSKLHVVQNQSSTKLTIFTVFCLPPKKSKHGKDLFFFFLRCGVRNCLFCCQDNQSAALTVLIWLDESDSLIAELVYIYVWEYEMNRIMCFLFIHDNWSYNVYVTSAFVFDRINCANIDQLLKYHSTLTVHIVLLAFYGQF